MTAPLFTSGDNVQFYSHSTGAWEAARYIGPRGNGRHAIETANGHLLTFGEGHLRAIPENETLQGALMIYRGKDGQLKIFGPYRDETEAVRDMENWCRIYPAGPDAIINISPYNIQFSLGQGVPFLGKKS